MCPAIVFIAALWISGFNLDYMVLGEDSGEVLPPLTLCLNCTVCQHPCHPLPLPPPSPLSGYPSYGAPPPPPSFSGYPSYAAPPPPPSFSTYPSYGAPPPPSRPVQANCPPVPANCPPVPVQYYQPVDDHSPTPYLPLTTFSTVILLLSFAVLF